MVCADCGEVVEQLTCGSCGADVRLDGRYTLVRALGEGGSGTTWHARDEQGRSWAIKEMSLWRARDPKTRELMLREAHILRELNHPAIPTYLEHFELGTGRSRSLYIVQEFVDGVTLDEELKTRRYHESEALDLADELLSVLGYLHRLSPPVIHRDVKPANIIRRGDGGLFLVDFGSVRDAMKDSRMGGSTVAGTFGFMAPEQFTGDATPATDLYGVGATLVAMLSRKAPHTLLAANGRLDWRPHVRIREGTEALLTALLHTEEPRRPRDASDAAGLVQSARFVALRDQGTPRLNRDDGPTPSVELLDVAHAQPVPDSLASLFEPVDHQVPSTERRPGWLARMGDRVAISRRFVTIAATMMLGASVGFAVALSPTAAGRLADVPQVPAAWQPLADSVQGHQGVQACLAYHEGLYEGEHKTPALMQVSRDPRLFDGLKVEIVARGKPLQHCIERQLDSLEPPDIKGAYTIEIPLTLQPDGKTDPMKLLDRF